MKRVNYLNNKDILKEIHKSKGSYCYYVDPKYSAYDFILVDPIEKMNKTKLLQARRNRADRLTKLKLNPDRADVIVPAGKIFHFILKTLGVKEIYVPKIGLADGMVNEII